MTQSVSILIEDAVAWITLNRPDALNAINDDIRRELPETLRAADADPQVRAIVLRGAGPRAFCVGADIKEFTKVDTPAAFRQSRTVGWIHAFDAVAKPLIASIHGYCLGGGLEIALACDLRIAALDAVFGFPETGHGIIPAAGGTQRISRVVGLGIAQDLVLTGERIDAARALAIGLVSRVAEPQALPALAGKVAQAIAAKPPLATQFAKEAVKCGADMEIAAGMRRELDLFTHLVNTEDRIEAARAFREKRPPRFIGK